MRVAVVIVGLVPNQSQSGSALTVWTIVSHLLSRGHSVTVLVLDEHAGDPGEDVLRRMAGLQALGAEVRLLPSRAAQVFDAVESGPRATLRRLWRADEVELHPNLLDAAAVREAVLESGADAVYAYHWEAMAATRELRGKVPRLATVVDLPHLSFFYRWRATPGKLSRAGLARLLWLQARLRSYPPALVRLLEECEAYGNFAAHHARALRRRGARRCEYLRTPIEDQGGEDWSEQRRRSRGGRPRILLIGHLRGISTLEGLDLFAQDVLPRLERELGADGFEVRLAGGYDPPPHLREALARPSVSLLGHLEHPHEEFRAADLLLVPTSISLGTRVRILTAFSFGCPVVAHEANARGIPELADGVNALLAKSGEELAEATLRVLRDDGLRGRLEQQGRRTYEASFAPGVAAARIEEILTSIAPPREAPEPSREALGVP